MSELIDNKAHRIRTLKEIIKHLHAGQPADQVRDQLKELVRETDYSEIAAMEEQLMAEGMPVEEIQCMCDLHSQVTRVRAMATSKGLTLVSTNSCSALAPKGTRPKSYFLTSNILSAHSAAETDDAVPTRISHNAQRALRPTSVVSCNSTGSWLPAER